MDLLMGTLNFSTAKVKLITRMSVPQGSLTAGKFGFKLTL